MSPARAAVPVALLALCVPAAAQTYPQRPVRMIAVAAGGGPDLIARLLAAKLAENLGQPFYVENRPGAGGNLGAEFVAKSAPDGHTLLLGSASQAISMTLYPKLGYDLERDFAPVSAVASAPFILVVHPALPAKSVRELIALARARRGELLFGSGGSGTPPHLAAEMLRTAARIEFVHVPYKGIMLAVNDLLGGHVQFAFVVTPIALPMMQAGRLRALAVTGAARSALAPELPPVGDTLPGFDVVGWYGLLAPAGTPRETVDRLHRETQAIVARPDVRERLVGLGAEPMAGSQAAFATFIQSEVRKWGTAVRDANARPE